MNILNIMKYCFKRNWNRRVTFMANLIIPILVVILGIFANTISQPGFTIGVINEQYATQVINRLSDTPGIDISYADTDTVKSDLITGKYSAIVAFSENSYDLFSVKDPKTNNEIRQILDSYQNSTQIINIYEVLGNEMSVAERTIAFIVLFLMVTSTVTASNMIKDKNGGTLRRYKYAPQTSLTYILGNFSYNYLITFFQYLISISFMYLIGVKIGIKYCNLLFMGIWLSGIATAFGTFFSSIYRKEVYANLCASFVALVLSLIGGTFIAYDNMPVMLQKISTISPLRWFIEITKSMQNGLGWFDNTQQIVILSGMIFILIIATSLVNKKQKGV